VYGSVMFGETSICLGVFSQQDHLPRRHLLGFLPLTQ
jgi:hypothetical protein